MPTPERYERVKRLFLEAGGLPRGERTRFLAIQCEGDTSLLEDVRALLTIDEADPGFLEDGAAAPENLAAPGLPSGARLGHFVVQRPLGEGGMGIVYEALEEQAGRRVALKLIRPGFVTARLRSRFRHEIRTLGQLRHPGIAQIYEAGTIDVSGHDLPYFAMELIDGRPLLEVARGLDVRGRLALLAQVCDAVHHAHQKGVIHRDLKPGNILVEEAPSSDPSGATGTTLGLQVKVLDFGIARAADPEAEPLSVRTDAGQLVGTLAYMSPEQAAGDADAVDTRSDVYSIGVVAYEALSGRLPYAVRGRAVHEAARLIHDSEPARLGAADRALRGDIETIVAKALEKEPRHRYQSAAEMGADLRRCLRDEPVLARPPSAFYQARKFARRHRALVGGALAVALAMAAATVFSTWQARIAVAARTFAEGQRERADRSADASRREAARAALAATAAAEENGDPIAARRLLDGVSPVERGWAWEYWRARLDRSVALVETGAPLAAAWFSPDASTGVALTASGRLLTLNPRSGKAAEGPALGDPLVTSAAFTADGARVVAVTGPSRRSLDEWDARTGALVRHIADLSHRGNLLRISGDGGVIAVGVKRISGSPPADDVLVWSGGAGEPRAAQTGGRTSGLELTPDGRTLALGYSGVSWCDSATLGLRKLAVFPSGGQMLAVTADGARIAAGGEDKTVRVLDRDTGAEQLSFRAHAGNITALAFDPSGSLIASAAEDRTIRVWDAATGAPRAVHIGDAARVRDLRFSADGKTLISIGAEGAVRLWQPQPDEGATILRGHDSYVYAVAFTPDGSRILSGSWDGTVRVWDAAGGACLGTLPVGDGFVTTLAVSPDGARFATGHKTGEWTPAAVRVWPLSSFGGAVSIPPAPLATALVPRGEPHDLRFAADGSLWLGWEHGAAGSIDLGQAPPAVHVLLPRFAARSITLSRDAGELACGGVAGEIALIRTATGERTRGWTAHRGRVCALAYDPVRGTLASAGADGLVKIWDPATGTLLHTLDRHWDKVFALAYSPDGAVLASGSEDTTIRLWDAANAEELTQLRGHESYVYALAFSPDGTRLVSGSGDHTVRVWDTRPLHARWRARQSEPGRESGDSRPGSEE